MPIFKCVYQGSKPVHVFQVICKEYLFVDHAEYHNISGMRYEPFDYVYNV